MKDIHLEHVWESENFERGKNFNSLVKKLMQRKEEDDWREQIEKKSKLDFIRE